MHLCDVKVLSDNYNLYQLTICRPLLLKPLGHLQHLD